MKVLRPDDYEAGKLVTVSCGPFKPMATPMPFGPFESSDPEYIEDTTYHGKVFRLVVFDPPWVILEPLDGVGEWPEPHQAGPFTILPHGKWVPGAIKLNITDGVELAQVSDEYAAAFERYFRPPPHKNKLQDQMAQLLAGLNPDMFPAEEPPEDDPPEEDPPRDKET